MLIKALKKFIEEKKEASWPDFVIKNAIKEYLQFPVLNFIYSQEEYQDFTFIGGSALRIVYNLPRLSEDLDFNLTPEAYEKLDLELLGERLEKYFQDKFLIKISFRVQGKQRLYLKFPILKELGLISEQSSSDFLYVKIEPSVDDFVNPKYDVFPISGFGFNFIIKTYILKFLMTGKIGAILERNWFKGEDNEVDIKGRDYYDLFWYLEKNIWPDYPSLSKKFSINNNEDLKVALKKRINDKVTEKKLFYDLANFFPEQEFISNFCKDYKKIINKYLEL